MGSVFILIPISIVLAFIIGYFFWWSGRHGQFDDLEGPAYRILMDDDSVSNEANDHELLHHTSSDAPTDQTQQDPS